MRTFYFLMIICTLFTASHTVQAQFLEDALRLEYGGLGSGARALGMGTAFLAVADDFSATFWNPAGLAQIRRNEFSVGLSNHAVGNNALYLGNRRDFTTSATNLNNLGFVIAVPTIQGSLSLALGYNKARDFSNALQFMGFNTASSIIPTLYNADAEYDMAYQLFLNDDDGFTTITDNVYQSGNVIERGGINHWSFSGAIEGVKDIYFGVTLNFLTGTYIFERLLIEEDTQDAHTDHPFDFARLELENTIDARITGFNVRIGMMYKLGNTVRIGAAISPPSNYSIDESFSAFGQSWFDDGDNFAYEIPGVTDYRVVTPWFFSGGASLSFAGITFAGAAEYSDWTQLEFRIATADVMRENRIIRETLQPAANYKAGVELEIPRSNLVLRAGYIYQESPYKNDPKEFDRLYLTAGAGFIVNNMLRFDVAFAHGTWETYRIHYVPVTGQPSRVQESVTQNTLLLTVGYRF